MGKYVAWAIIMIVIMVICGITKVSFKPYGWYTLIVTYVGFAVIILWDIFGERFKSFFKK